MSGSWCGPNDLDSDSWALNATNGTIDLRTGKLRPHDPAEMHTKTVATAFVPGAPADAAIWRRLRLVPFTVTMREHPDDPGDGPVKDTGLEGKLMEEREVILAWAVEGCVAWQAGGLRPPEAVMAATDNYREESTPLREWIDAECELDPSAVTPATLLRESYERWCRDTRTTKLPRGNEWSAALESVRCSRPGGDERGRAVIDGRQVVAWEGIRLQPHGGDSPDEISF